MRTTQPFVFVAAWLAASGCMKVQDRQPTEAPVAATPPPAPPAQVGTEPSSPEGTSPAREPGGGPAVALAAPARPSSHDLLIAALACIAGPSEGESSSGLTGPAASSDASPSQDCGSAAGPANVSPHALRSGDRSAADAVRGVIEEQAKSENLSDAMHGQLLGLYDRGMAAARERNGADAVAARFPLAGATGGGPRPLHRRASRSASGAERRERSGAGVTLTAPDADMLRAHDKLLDLVQFAHGSNAGPLASEAEGLAWLLAAERFMTTSRLPPSYKVLAAEPLFETLLGVPTPAVAKGDPGKIPNRAWSDYLAAASRAAREGGFGRPTGIGGGAGESTDTSSGARKPSTRARTDARSAGGKDASNWNEVVSVLEQRIDALARQLPPSDLRQTLGTYAQQLRTEAVGGGPAQPPMPSGAPPASPRMQAPPPSGGSSAPVRGPRSGSPGGGGIQPGGGSPNPTNPAD